MLAHIHMFGLLIVLISLKTFVLAASLEIRDDHNQFAKNRFDAFDFSLIVVELHGSMEGILGN